MSLHAVIVFDNDNAEVLDNDNEVLDKMDLKSTIKCFKEMKIDKWLDLSY